MTSVPVATERPARSHCRAPAPDDGLATSGHRSDADVQRAHEGTAGLQRAPVEFFAIAWGRTALSGVSSSRYLLARVLW